MGRIRCGRKGEWAEEVRGGLTGRVNLGDGPLWVAGNKMEADKVYGGFHGGR